MTQDLTPATMSSPIPKYRDVSTATTDLSPTATADTLSSHILNHASAAHLAPASSKSRYCNPTVRPDRSQRALAPRAFCCSGHSRPKRAKDSPNRWQPAGQTSPQQQYQLTRHKWRWVFWGRGSSWSESHEGSCSHAGNHRDLAAKYRIWETAYPHGNGQGVSTSAMQIPGEVDC